MLRSIVILLKYTRRTESIVWSFRIAAQFVIIFLIIAFWITKLILINESIGGLVRTLITRRVIVLFTQPITALVTKLITELIRSRCKLL